MNNLFIYGFCLFTLIEVVLTSTGDQTSYFINCKRKCIEGNCTKDGIKFLPNAKNFYNQTIFDKLLCWSCIDECQYSCMWRTVNAFIDRNWKIPQFYGKWPFIKILGLQEPASVVFSLMNLVTNIVLLKKFKKEVRPDSPCYNLWHIYSYVNINGWIWSTVYHARDFNITELLDYVFAYSIILINFYCFIIRLIYNSSIIFRGIITCSFVTFFLNYFTFLSDGHLNYSTNMQLNIITGILSGLGWIIWSFYTFKKRKYCWKILLFFVLVGLSLSLEILDFPPYLWLFDAHSLWHLSSVPITILFYSFVIDDCKALRKEEMDSEKFNKYK